MKLHSVEAGELSAGDAKFAVVAARFNSSIVNNLLQKCLQTLQAHDVRDGNIEVVHVPGAYELPLAARHLINTHKYAAIITLGCVIRGDTPHFDFVAGECARGIMNVSLDAQAPVVFGVLTTDTLEQAQARSQLDGENKGADCALCALEMVNVIKNIRASS